MKKHKRTHITPQILTFLIQHYGEEKRKNSSRQPRFKNKNMEIGNAIYRSTFLVGNSYFYFGKKFWQWVTEKTNRHSQVIYALVLLYYIG